MPQTCTDKPLHHTSINRYTDKMNKTPKITVLILTYNRAHLVERSIKSVLNQTFEDYELVLVDNGSTDHTPEVFEKYQNRKNIRIFRIEKNIGFARGFNFCLDQIRGEWFATVGDDDEIRDNAFEILFNILNTVDPNLTAINSNGLDSATGTFSGTGLYEDQFLPIETIVKYCDGDFWGITKTSLIENRRLNTKIPGLENTFWYKIDAIARRYYIHQQLITYHTDHGPRETSKQNDGIEIKAMLYKELLKESFFWDVLKKYNKKQFRDRCVKAMHFLKATGNLETFSAYQKMLLDDDPGIKYKLRSSIINLLSPEILSQLYNMKQRAS